MIITGVSSSVFKTQVRATISAVNTLEDNLFDMVTGKIIIVFFLCVCVFWRRGVIFFLIRGGGYFFFWGGGGVWGFQFFS